MKFTQLTIGQRFIFEAAPYTKTGPLTARNEHTGEARLIPRSARLGPPPEAAKPATAPHSGPFSAAQVESALAGLTFALLDVAKELDDATRSQVETGLKRARQTFLAELGLDDD